MIDLIIPTLWLCPEFEEILLKYCSYEKINKIIVINNTASKPKVIHDKVFYINYRKNIFVNPAWNEGVAASTSDIICILNDDIFVQESIFNKVSKLDFTNIDLIGLDIKNNLDVDTISKIEFEKNKAIGQQYYGFGMCMFMKRKSYKIIPSLYKIWFGDDYLAHNSKNIYVLSSKKISGSISTSIKKFPANSFISNRIFVDQKNAYKYLIK